MPFDGPLSSDTTVLLLLTLCMAVSFFVHAAAVAEEKQGLQCSFGKGQWHPEHWIMVKSPRWEHIGAWVQREDYIENTVPAKATPEDLQGKSAGETYTSMVGAEKQQLPFTLHATFAFTARMAPSIILAPTLGKDEDDYPEYREHLEITFWDQGVNIWHQQYNDGKVSWKCLARFSFKLLPDTPYEAVLQVMKKSQGQELSLRLGDTRICLWTDLLSDSLYTGITACEGVNRFYAFELDTP